MKKYIATISSLAMVISTFAFVPIAGAATLTVGNDTTVRATVDTLADFVIVDSNHPASNSGTLDSFSYYAANTNPFRFVLVDNTNKVLWVSSEITPPGTGVQTFIPVSPVSVQSGDNLGLYFKSTGTIPFESTGSLASYTSGGYGVPVMNSTLTINGTDSRTYSFVATGTTEIILPGTLSAEDFGVVNYDTGLGMLKGYTAGFGLTDATFAGATSIVVRLYAAGDQLLQTNTAIISKFNADITGTQFSSPFDVSGTFNYATDGYWTNHRETQYGQSVPATKVVATVTLANTKVVAATNTSPTGDPTTIYPANVNITTNPATLVTLNDATLNGINGGSAAIGHSFWVSLAPFVTTSPIIPSGVYSTPDFGAIAANTAFSASLSSITTAGVPGNLPAITPNTKYYFAAWSFIGDTWYPGAVLNFTTANTGTINAGMISGKIYNDLNKNEAKDSGEPGIAGFTIKLYNVPGWSGPSDIAPIKTAITDANGNYSFGNLADGTYSVEEVNLPAWHQDTGDYSPLIISNGVAITNIDFANTAKKGGEKEKDNGGNSFQNNFKNMFGRINGLMHGNGNKFGLLKHGVSN